MVDKKYCKRCQGVGQVDTGLMESPVTICNNCNGTGEAQTTPPQRTWVEVESIKWEGTKLMAKLKENT